MIQCGNCFQLDGISQCSDAGVDLVEHGRQRKDFGASPELYADEQGAHPNCFVLNLSNCLVPDATRLFTLDAVLLRLLASCVNDVTLLSKETLSPRPAFVTCSSALQGKRRQRQNSAFTQVYAIPANILEKAPLSVGLS